MPESIAIPDDYQRPLIGVRVAENPIARPIDNLRETGSVCCLPVTLTFGAPATVQQREKLFRVRRP